MIRKIFLFFAILLLAPGLVFAQDEEMATADSEGESVAVIVAVEFYSAGWAWRPDAYKDANKVAWVLSNNGFEVLKLYGKSATEEKIKDGLAWATKKSGPEGHVLVYFSGHGVHPKSDPEGDYIVPYGAERDNDSQLMKIDTVRSEVLDYVKAENALFIFDTGSTLDQPNKNLGTIQELATVLKEGMTGAADEDHDGKVEFSELAEHIGPKVQNVKIEARPEDEIYITEDMVTVISSKIPKKKRRNSDAREHQRIDQFDSAFEQKMEEMMRKVEEIDKKMQEMDRMMENRRLPLPR